MSYCDCIDCNQRAIAYAMDPLGATRKEISASECALLLAENRLSEVRTDSMDLDMLCRGIELLDEREGLEGL